LYQKILIVLTLCLNFALVKKYLFIVSFMMLLKPVIPVFQYIVNYEYISKVLCINTEKPAMKCNGKCHLMQELAKASESEKPLSDKKASHSEIEILFFEQLKDFNFTFKQVTVLQETTTFYSNLYSHINSNPIFHPPSINF